jgi:hypothetical protein
MSQLQTEFGSKTSERPVLVGAIDYSVVASEAKQSSRKPVGHGLDCFVASLLGMGIN